MQTQGAHPPSRGGAAQLIVVSPLVWPTLKFTGIEAQTRWVMVTVQAVPDALVTQVTVGVPAQVVVTVPTVATGVRMTGSLTFTHCVAILAQPVTGQEA